MLELPKFDHIDTSISDTESSENFYLTQTFILRRSRKPNFHDTIKNPIDQNIILIKTIFKDSIKVKKNRNC